MELETLYNKLLKYYGPQNWWPGEGFEIAIGAILTQNTNWSNVEKALKNLKEKDIITPDKILDLDITILKQLISPAGFFNQKANYLRNLCELWIRNSKPSREELLDVKGIGAETADSILLYLLNEPEFVIDTYTIRICNRLGINTSKDKAFWKEYFESKISENIEMYNEFHALLVIHAKTFCSKNNPKCLSCFLKQKCDYAK